MLIYCRIHPFNLPFLHYILFKNRLHLCIINFIPPKKSYKMNKQNLFFWLSTGFIFLFEGLMPALTGHSELGIQAITHLGYPEYFVTLLVVYKVLGSLALVLPIIPSRLKEWAYAGITFNLISASVSNGVVDGLGFGFIFPLIILGILMVSYYYFHKRQEQAAPALSA